MHPLHTRNESSLFMAPPLPLNSLAIAGIVCISLSTVFGIASIVCTAIWWRNYWDDYLNYVVAAVSTGAISLVIAIIAYPLTFKAAQRYMKQQPNSTGVKGLMIAAWVLYGFLILIGIALIVVGAFDQYVAPGWVLFLVLWGIVGWSFMLVHQEKARKSQSNVLPQSNVSAIAVAYNEPTPTPSNTSTMIETRVNKDGTRTRNTIKRSMNPDGTVTVEEKVEMLGMENV